MHWIKKFWNETYSWIREFWNEVSTWIKKLWNKIPDWIKFLLAGFLSAFLSIQVFPALENIILAPRGILLITILFIFLSIILFWNEISTWIKKFWNEHSAWIKILSISILLIFSFIGLYWYLFGIKFDKIYIEYATDFRDFFIPIAAIAFIPFAIWRMTMTYRQTNIQQQSVHTESYFKAIGNLKDKDISIRAGAIYGLENIARESKDHHLQIVELLCSYIREKTKKAKSKAQGNKSLAIDIQAALDVLGRRSDEWIKKIERPREFSMNLDGIHIKEANLLKLNFKHANLRGAQLQGAVLIEAQLKDAFIYRANLEDANLMGAQLQDATLWETQLQDVNLATAYLEGAQLWRTQLEGANLYEAHLEGANLAGADLKGTNNLEQAQIDSAFGDKATKIPGRLTRPKHWLDRALDEIEATVEGYKWKDNPKKYRPPKE